MKHSLAKPDAIRQIVRHNYAKITNVFGTEGHAGDTSPCCPDATASAEGIGYSRTQIASAPDAAHMGLGCGNPHSIAGLNPGETVVDLGSGAGFDCFLAARAVGATGRVIGVDMTEAMIRKARSNAKKAGVNNVEFRIGEIERLPVTDSMVDVIISNCVINLSPEKKAVFREAYRVLKPGGRLAISDVVAVRPLPATMHTDEHMHCACIGGAVLVEDLRRILESEGFEKILITPLEKSRDLIKQWVPGENAQDYVVSALIQATKPGANGTQC